MLDNQTKKRIDDCRDILVGKITDPKSQVEQITIAMIYKFMDDMDLQSEEYGGSRQFFVGDYQKYSWSKIFSPRVDADEMLNLYGEGIEKMSENPNLNPLFRSIFKDAYLPYRDPETLKLFLKTIDGFSYEHSEKLGDAYEYLLSVLGSQGGAGQFRTPRHVIDFIVDLVEPKKGDRILDPACGTSGFLISSYKRILERNTDKKLGDKLSSMEKKQLLNSIYGYDLDPNMVRLSLVNLFLHGFTEDELNVIEYDSLTSEDRWNEYFDVILANPPFMTPKGGIRPHNRFSIKSNRAEVLFVNYIMEHLTPKGRAGIVVPEGIIFQSGTAYKQLRKSLVEKYLIGVVSLPSGVFNPYSGVKTSILILDRELSQKTDKIFFGKVENDGYGLGAQRREIDKNDLPKIKEGVLDYVQNLTNGIDEEHPNLSYVSKENILNSSDIGLSFERYINDSFQSQKWDMVVLGEVSDLIRGITFGKKDQLNEKSSNSISVITTKAAQSEGVNYEDVYYVPKVFVKKDEKYLNEGDILISTANSLNHLGRTTYIDNKIQPHTSFGAFMSCIRVREEISSKFVFYLISSKFARKYFTSVARTTTNISNLNFSDLELFKIPLPPLEIQKEIVEELEQYQKVIDGAKQVVDNYKPHIDIDESWEEIELGTISEIKSGGTPSKKESSYWTNGTIPWVGSSVCKNNFLDKVETYITELGLSKSSAKIFPKNTILIALVGATIGKTSFLNTETSTNQNIAGVKVKDITNTNPKFIFYSIQMLYSKFFELGEGKFRMANLSFVKGLTISIPPIKIQNQIVEKLEEERQIVKGNKKLIETYTQKIEDRINKIWGE